MIRKKKSFFLAALFFVNLSLAQESQRVYLSGTGNDKQVEWEFYCTEGNNARKWTKIPVPSNWELEGFGRYNYGFDKAKKISKEQGLYKHTFRVSPSWKNKQINLVFEGVMTDAEVKINGKLAGPIHQGAYYAFKYDISKLLRYDKENLLEVKVAKHSADSSVNAAERQGDFWLFGGIFRPVWLEILPTVHIERVSIDAQASGDFKAKLLFHGKGNKIVCQIYSSDGKAIGQSFSQDISPEQKEVNLQTTIAAPSLWSSEFPTLYEAVFEVYAKNKVVHRIKKRFGFRTVEVRARDGIYVNGVKMKFKGVNRHSFWPTTGRTTSKQISIQDVELMKAMNMNAVRMSHYPPDDHFLDVCDSLGLFVMDELAGWHGHYDTPIGTKLLKEMMMHDENHPSIVIWANGNEGGHNFDLDSIFLQEDMQKRPVIHPWQLFGGIETQHYREYNYGIGNYNNGREIVMPTEFLHGMYDGGHGAGLEDYWEHMWADPLSAGGFLWDFADQGVVRKDKKDSIDTDGNHAADGIVGPHREKEGSFYAIKEIWSPIFLERKEITSTFNGLLRLENRYAFTNLNQCSFTWKLKKWDIHGEAIDSLGGLVKAPDIKPFEKGNIQLDLPSNWNIFNVLYVTAYDPYRKELFTWSFPTTRPKEIAENFIQTDGNQAIQMEETDSLYIIQTNDLTIHINNRTGILQKVSNGKGDIPFNNGPILQQGENNFGKFTYRKENGHLIINSSFDKKSSYNTLEWTIYPSGWIKLFVRYFPGDYFTDFVGLNFSSPKEQMLSVQYMGMGPYRVWKNRIKGQTFGVWTKAYNDSETGEAPWLYPEFKGYHANMYWSLFQTKGHSFKVVTPDEDVFLRLYTPAHKEDPWKNYDLVFPTGDISFMQGISGIGTKTQKRENTGPMGMKNIFYDYEKDPTRAKELTLYFDFTEK
ncbi:glycoside hydrolase family 2 protein [Olivibacter domesticus]|uniref:beta-galactosidase n=1 Tax=Olivibacter domesticus TaxID=407022 RepID=A0A1H7U227_OLID1|nr:glycoside hydrolase family 2 TIM barrel-domain containing protein [Olivibacter domesticus]SEL90307.1 Beta galactosidase small chain [Olivibacter domesticus]